jgi:hypothetical protein
MGRGANNAFDLVHGLGCRPERLCYHVAVTSAQNNGSTFPVRVLAAFSAFGGALFVVDLTQWEAPDRVRMRRAFTALDGRGIVGLVRRHGGGVA